jgi:hypothetical protein
MQNSPSSNLIHNAIVLQQSWGFRVCNLRYNKVVQHDMFLYFSYSNQETKWVPGDVLVLMLLQH